MSENPHNFKITLLEIRVAPKSYEKFQHAAYYVVETMEYVYKEPANVYVRWHGPDQEQSTEPVLMKEEYLLIIATYIVLTLTQGGNEV